MKHTHTLVAGALSAILASVALAGCGDDMTATTDATETMEVTEFTETSNQSQEELLTEFRAAISNIPPYQSVTIIVDESSVTADDADPLSTTTVYKFDKSGDKLRTSADVDIMGIKMYYVTEGDDAVLVTDGPVYAGTTEQFDLEWTDGAEAFVKDTVGDFEVLADCGKTVEKMSASGLVAYTLTLDAEKYVASDEILQMLANSGTQVQEATVTFTFDEDARIAAIDLTVGYTNLTSYKSLMFSDYDSTTVDAMPKATKTYEEMEANTQTKLDAVFGEDQVTSNTK